MSVMPSSSVHVIGVTCYGWLKDEKGVIRQCKQIEESGVCSKCGEDKVDMRGHIIYKNKYFVVVQGGHYRESFLKADIDGDHIRVYTTRKGGSRGVNKKRKYDELGFTQQC